MERETCFPTTNEEEDIQNTFAPLHFINLSSLHVEAPGKHMHYIANLEKPWKIISVVASPTLFPNITFLAWEKREGEAIFFFFLLYSLHPLQTIFNITSSYDNEFTLGRKLCFRSKAVFNLIPYPPFENRCTKKTRPKHIDVFRQLSSEFGQPRWNLASTQVKIMILSPWALL